MTYPTQRYLAARPDGHTLDGIPGDCYAACIAILLDVPLDDLPHFVMHGDRWWDLTRRTVRDLRPGLDIQCFTPSPWPLYDDPDALDPSQRLCVATGPSPRGPFLHCVVIDSITGDLVWDPHPSRDGLAGDITLVDLLVPAYDPAPADPIALPAAPARTALDRVARMQAAGQMRVCRQTRPLSEADAQVLVEFADQLRDRTAHLDTQETR